MNLTLQPYDRARMALAEWALGKPIGAILAEVESTDGMSLQTLRALVGAALAAPGEVAVGRLLASSLVRADALIDRDGLAAVSAAVGNALGHFMVGLRAGS
ncbi:hypothetical protein ACT6QH_01935 [Xanthobacter sp. TB0139]|uniref:hypothetical protein n=1 Tax=Xanthobacter sp. TB0139 TaxID=3459178 RepID=UPI004039C90A